MRRHLFFLTRVFRFIAKKTEDADLQLVPFGIVMFINFFLYYIIWLKFNQQTYENLFLRATASTLCLILSLKNYWPRSFTKFLPIYWYFTAGFCLPFFFVLMTIKNHGSTIWLMNCVSALFFLMLLFDLLSALFLILLGGFAAYLSFISTTQEAFYFNPGDVNALGIIATMGAAFIIGGIFAHNKQLIQNAKLNGMMAAGANIAHELRTPLGSITNGIKGIKRYFPTFLDSYRIAKEHNLNVPEIRPDHFETLATLLDDVESETEYSNTVINMLLVKVKHSDMSYSAMEECTISECIQRALERYPFTSDKKNQLIHWDDSNNFTFKGNQMLMVHVLFNLIKNSLYYIEEARKGEIYISTKVGKKHNHLHFKDTGKGIPKNILPKLFTRFFSTSANGTGLGLTFCKMVMESFGGSVTCHSIESEYTEFTLHFPKT